MIHHANINTLLVVLNQDLIWSGESKQSPLIERAASLARRTGCEIPYFSVIFVSFRSALVRSARSSA